MAPIPDLYAQYVYPNNSNNLPICLLMHGWSGDGDSFDAATMQRIAGYGLFVASIGMRGRNSADGLPDASGREIHDIYDALAYIRTTYAAVVSTDKAAIVGYSGGGGNALAAACKFPDAFNCAVSHFGMSDYGRDGTDGWYANNPGTYTAGIASWVGGTPVAVPDNYYARDATAAILNYSGGHLYLYHDKGDNTVPWVHSNRIKAALDGASRTNYTASFTDVGDSPRWTHGYPADTPDLILTEALWKDAILNNVAWTIPASGTVTVIGYIVTKRFTIWLGTGVSEAASVIYNTATDTYTVTPLTGEVAVTITQGAKTVTQTISSGTTLTVV